ncbi:hypothetical protein [Mucilaginibacter sp. OK268]|uniref:hypothetical protein n=1 Tax=Mucilaginibacter sp. OK268 TaxID=1881048 RepID=UPI00115FAC0A|nr:hypothetical protein [Mucilaginibacter sp. OK268]
MKNEGEQRQQDINRDDGSGILKTITMILLASTTDPVEGSILPVIFTIIGAIWTLSVFFINYQNEKLKKKIEHFKLLKDYNAELKKWANNTIDLMSTAGHLCLLDPKKDSQFYNQRHNLLIALSAEIDKGRFFLPNTEIDGHGQYKAAAYQGFRVKALNVLVDCYDLVKSIDYMDQQKNIPVTKQIMECKRNFVSEVQIQLDPRKFEIDFIETIKQGL